MESNLTLKLLYIKNGIPIEFPVYDVDHAVRLADAIADSDLLNDDVDYNMFDLLVYRDGEFWATWGTDVEIGGPEIEEDFREYWQKRKVSVELKQE